MHGLERKQNADHQGLNDTQKDLQTSAVRVQLKPAFLMLLPPRTVETSELNKTQTFHIQILRNIVQLWVLKY